MIGAVFDTNIYFQAAVNNKGPASACWEYVEKGIVRVYITESIIAEIEDALSRPKIRRQFPVLTDERIKIVMATYLKYAEHVQNVEKKYRLERDSDDEQFIDLALTVGADFIVSRDKDLLDLRPDSAFTSQYPSLRIVNPFEFLQMVRKE